MIYQILIDRFNGGWNIPPKNKNCFLGGNLNGITSKLDYICSLGASAIWPSPFFKTESYHGYHITDYKQIEPSFGTWNDLYELINNAHNRGLKVIADFVPNHCHINHPFFQETIKNKNSKYREWFYINKKNDYKAFLWYNILPKFNLENKDTANYLLGIGTDLIKIGIDGLRIDHALGVPMSFLSNLRDRVHNVNPNATVFGEVWSFNVPRKYFNTLFFKNPIKRAFYTVFGINQETIQRDYSGVLDGILDFEFRNIIINEIKTGNRIRNNKELNKKLDCHFTFYKKHNLTPFLFLDNHDTDRFLFECKNDKSLMMEALELMRSYPYPHIIYYGTECYMANTTTIINAEDYADLRVREPMKWE